MWFKSNKKNAKLSLEDEVKLLNKEVELLKTRDKANLDLTTFLLDEMTRLQKELTKALGFIMQNREWILYLDSVTRIDMIEPTAAPAQEPKKDFTTLPELYKKNPGDKSN